MNIPRFRLPLLLLALSIAAALFAEEAAVPTSAAAYPLDYCIVSGEKLGSMGAPVVKSYDGREVKFCCPSCVSTFEKSRAKWEKKLDQAIIAERKETYPLETCVVSGEPLGGMGKPTEYVYQNRLVRFCCDGCIKTFEKDPPKYLSMIDAARALPKESPAEEVKPEEAGQ